MIEVANHQAFLCPVQSTAEQVLTRALPHGAGLRSLAG